MKLINIFENEGNFFATLTTGKIIFISNKDGIISDAIEDGSFNASHLKLTSSDNGDYLKYMPLAKVIWEA
jgi:hypothetical protein